MSNWWRWIIFCVWLSRSRGGARSLLKHLCVTSTYRLKCERLIAALNNRHQVRIDQWRSLESRHAEWNFTRSALISIIELKRSLLWASHFTRRKIQASHHRKASHDGWKKKFSTRDLELQIAHSSRPRYELALFANSQSKIDGNFSTFFSLKGFRFVTSLVVPVSALDASQTKKNPIGGERRSAHEILSHSPKRALWCMQNCSKSKNRNWLILFRFFVVEFSVESEAHWSKKLSACSNRKWHLVRAAMQCNNVSSSLFLRLLFDAKWARNFFSAKYRRVPLKHARRLSMPDA